MSTKAVRAEGCLSCTCAYLDGLLERLDGQVEPVRDVIVELLDEAAHARPDHGRRAGGLQDGHGRAVVPLHRLRRYRFSA